MQNHEDESTSLLQGRRYTRRLNDSGVSEDGSFPSPGDLRSVGARGGSAGDGTRRLVSALNNTHALMY